MGEHSRVSPSGLTRTRLCPGSVQAVEHLARSSDLVAAEGTLLHEIAADCLQFGFEPYDYVGRTMNVEGFDFEITADLVSPMLEGLDWAREQPGRMFVEERVRLEPWMPGQFGSLDIGWIDGDLATIFDWKFGWIRVELLNNEQLRAYALGFYVKLLALQFKPKRFRLIIEQPRVPGGYRYFTPWEITLDELLPYGATMSEILAAADTPGAPRHAGEKQCFYCDAKEQPGGCDAHIAFLLELASLKFEDLDGAEPVLPPHGSLTPERRGFVVRHGAMFSKWVSQLAAETLADGLAGNPTPGHKVVVGQQGDRKWVDKELAEALMVPVLSDQAFTKKLISPAGGEKLLKPRRGFEGKPDTWEKLLALIDRDEGKPTLADADDSREAMRTWEQKFED